MNHSNNKPVCSDGYTGPLAIWLEPFADWLHARGYASITIRRKVRLVSRFSFWLQQEAIPLSSIRPAHRDQFLRYRDQFQGAVQNGERHTLELITEFLRQKGQILPARLPEEPKTAVELCLQSYEDHLRRICGLTPTTIGSYLPFAGSFLRYCFGSGAVTLSRLSSEDVVGYVQQQAPRLNMSMSKCMTTALRSLLRFACHLGETGPELVDAVPSTASWRRFSIPRGISTDQTEKLLASIKCDTAMGRRDYAIVMLFARLGVRVSEVQALRLDDIDWINGTLRLQGKGSQHRTVPMTEEIGEAIVDYLHRGRPQCASRHVFLRTRAPIGEFCGAAGICAILRRVIRRGGIVAPTNGTHQFRHGLATEMLRRKLSLEQIGDFLGHAHPDTTRIYARVDLEALRSLALPWPGGEK